MFKLEHQLIDVKKQLEDENIYKVIYLLNGSKVKTLTYFKKFVYNKDKHIKKFKKDLKGAIDYFNICYKNNSCSYISNYYQLINYSLKKFKKNCKCLSCKTKKLKLIKEQETK